MCRNIRTLFNFEPPATDAEIQAAALQFVRKLSGFNAPSRANEAAFRQGVDEVTLAARRLVRSLVTSAPPRDRAQVAAAARARNARRFGSSAALLLLTLLAAPQLQAARPAGPGWCGTRPHAARDARFAHLEEQARRGASDARRTRAVAAPDVDEIAVLQDEGDLALLRRPFDLAGAGLQWSPAREGYSVSRVDRPVAAVSGERLPLGDDDSREITLPFGFPFYGRTWTSAFVNSDGNLSFGQKDDASTARSLGRVLAGPPRIAALFADLDPSAGGGVTLAAAGDSLSVTWTDVPRFGESDKNTFQVTLRRDGQVSFAWDPGVSTQFDEGVVGLAPGAEAGGFTAVDLSGAAGASGPGALAESFRASDELDTLAVARKFYATHPDDYQQLVVYTSRRLVEPGTFAYEVTLRNTDAGLGAGSVDFGADYGSRARLESFVDMDYWLKYRDALDLVFLGEDNTLSVLAHEVGHRWLAHARYLDGAARMEDLLGRQRAHWSFFAHTAGSHMEGNDIEDQGGGRFRTRPGSQRYSPLDQYLMGLRAPEEVPPFFVVRNPTGIDPDPEQGPRRDALFSGTRKDVTIQDVIAALGPRNPPPGPREPWRQAFVYVNLDPVPDPAALARIERIRAAFPGFFARSTDGRGALLNTLR